jgi:hypothetical protein
MLEKHAIMKHFSSMEFPFKNTNHSTATMGLETSLQIQNEVSSHKVSGCGVIDLLERRLQGGKSVDDCMFLKHQGLNGQSLFFMKKMPRDSQSYAPHNIDSNPLVMRYVEN